MAHKILLGDLNNDGNINGADIGLWCGMFGTDNPLGDLDNNGIVDAADLGILLSNWVE
jgi:hypothetical protein